MASLINIHTTKDLKAKLKLENILRPEVKKIFNQILNDFRVTYATTGLIPNGEKYNSGWREILQRHYQRAQKRFTKKVSITKAVEGIEEDEDKDLLILALATWREENSLSSSEQIGKTTSSMMIIAINESRVLLAEQGEILSNRNIAATANKLLKRRFKGRINNILMSETQKAVESSKQITAEHMEKLLLLQEPVRLFEPVKSLITKIWRTVGDNRVRPTHKIANGQTRKLNEAYIVGGQLLMSPGDGSLGATPKETNGCRCSSIIRSLGKVIDFHG